MYYIICSTPRSGSTLLAESLVAMGAGKPEEYLGERVFNGRATQLAKHVDFMQPTPLAYVERIKQENTIDRIFGLKTHYSQMSRYPEIANNLTNIFPDAKYISITRRNILRQVFSAMRATQTRAWSSKLPQKRKPYFNPLGIVKHFILIAQEIELWEQFYSRHNISPLRILYEDLEDNYEATMRKVVDYLGVHGDIPPPPIKKQADGLTDAWVDRYINYLREDRWYNRILRRLMLRF